jgi:dihydrofolate synthase / folylpolyglutamate synthase
VSTECSRGFANAFAELTLGDTSRARAFILDAEVIPKYSKPESAVVVSMSYAKAIDQLNAMVPELYTRTGHQRRKFSLDEFRTLLTALGDPHKKFPSILIAGTNGKGSTAATLASILRAAGLRTGLYTSPHLERVNERIRINGVEIEDAAFAKQFFRIQEAAEQLVNAGRLPQKPSFFEVLTALGFLQFAEEQVQIAVLEVGMGGRLDATNVVEPLVSVITDISLDHMEWLGSTIGAIAREKAGILRRGGTMITLPQHPEANQVLGEVAIEHEATGVSATSYLPSGEVTDPYAIEVLGEAIEVDSPLKGVHQHRNIALAVAASVELAQRHGFNVTHRNISDGIRNTQWPGRFERFTRGGINWILDVAHNPAGAWALRAALRLQPEELLPRTLIFSCLRDKPVTEMAQILFPLFEKVILAPIHSARATSIEDLKTAADATGVAIVIADSVEDAIRLAEREASNSTHNGVAISGSLYLVGEARRLLLNKVEAKQ